MNKVEPRSGNSQTIAIHVSCVVGLSNERLCHMLIVVTIDEFGGMTKLDGSVPTIRSTNVLLYDTSERFSAFHRVSVVLCCVCVPSVSIMLAFRAGMERDVYYYY